MTLAPEIIDAIGQAVEAQGGDLDDALDLAATWERLHAYQGGRADRLRYEAANPVCRCADGGKPEEGDQRCGRCCGYLTAQPRGARS
jgi:hypothetical protein